jgi:hypothetical protein
MDQKDSRTQPEVQPGRAGHYEPPGIEWEEPIDVQANLTSACAKIASNPLCAVSPAS